MHELLAGTIQLVWGAGRLAHAAPAVKDASAACRGYQPFLLTLALDDYLLSPLGKHRMLVHGLGRIVRDVVAEQVQVAWGYTGGRALGITYEPSHVIVLSTALYRMAHDEPWRIRRTLAHELGHALGMSHRAANRWMALLYGDLVEPPGF